MADIIPFDQRDGALWFDGKLVPWREAKIHVLTHGLHYASCVFEGERLYNGRIYKLAEHTARLFESARILGMKIPYTEAEIDKACYAAAESQGGGDFSPLWSGQNAAGCREVPAAQLTRDLTANL